MLVSSFRGVGGGDMVVSRNVGKSEKASTKGGFKHVLF